MDLHAAEMLLRAKVRRSRRAERGRRGDGAVTGGLDLLAKALGGS